MKLQKEIAANKIRSAWLKFTSRSGRSRATIRKLISSYHLEDSCELWCGCIDTCRGRCGFREYDY